MQNQPIKITCDLRHAGKPIPDKKITPLEYLWFIPIGWFIVFVLLGGNS